MLYEWLSTAAAALSEICYFPLVYQSKEYDSKEPPSKGTIGGTKEPLGQEGCNTLGTCHYRHVARGKRIAHEDKEHEVKDTVNMNWNRRQNGNGPERSFEEYLQDIIDRPSALLFVILAIVIGSGIFSSYYMVRPQEKGVVTRFGEFIRIADEGLHFKLPFGVDRVVLVPTKVQEEAFGFTPTGRELGLDRRTTDSRSRDNIFLRSSRTSGKRNVDEESLMLTGDLNVADVEWVVQYRVINPKDFLFNVADPVKNIRDLTQTTMRKVVGDRSINDILTTGRGEIQSAVQVDMQKVIDETYKMGISIEEVILQDVAPPEPVQPSFNQVNSALQEQKQEINKALEDQNSKIPAAHGEANRRISEARGYREAVVNRAIGDASRFEQILEEYEKAPAVTRTRIYLELVQDMFKKVRNFTVVDPAIKGLLPIFSSPQDSGRIGGTSQGRASLSPSSMGAPLNQGNEGKSGK